MITTRRPAALLAAMALAAGSGAAMFAPAQEAAPASAPDAADAERQKILSSERWQTARKNWNNWLQVQQVYSADEVAALRHEINSRLATMSPSELNEFLTDMEERVVVLMSPEADEARAWVSQILAVARNPEAHFGGPLPDVGRMSAGEIRQELERFQRERAARRRSQEAFDRSRQRSVQAAIDSHNAAATVTPRTAATFREPTEPYHSPYAPRRVSRRPVSIAPPVYRFGPWGEPIRWHPLRDWEPWRYVW